MSAVSLVVAIVTHRRETELARLLASLRDGFPHPERIVICDHAPGGGVRAVAEASGLPVRVVEDAGNPGPGAGWTRAATAGLEDVPDAGSLLFLDDDVVLPPGALAAMVEGLREADLVAPLLEDAEGVLWGIPEPCVPAARKAIRRAHTPAEAVGLLGERPLSLCWCTGACVLVRTTLYKTTGPHRPDFFMLGEDLEFSMRASTVGRAVFLPKVSVPHLPPPSGITPSAARIKFCCLLQNLCHLSFHAPHSRHMRMYLPGNFRRFLRDFGIGGVADAIRCFVYGAILGEPAGGAHGRALHAAIARRMSSP